MMVCFYKLLFGSCKALIVYHKFMGFAALMDCSDKISQNEALKFDNFYAHKKTTINHYIHCSFWNDPSSEATLAFGLFRTAC